MQVVYEHACCSLLDHLPYLLFVSRVLDIIPLSVISRFLNFMALSNDHTVRKHAYEALESSQHIRLIILHPASSADAPLKVTFQQAKLSELQGRYEAISYTWGQPDLTCPLHVSDGTHVLVTENLDRALRYLRRSYKDRFLWADAACINQADGVEKSAQIPLMVQIFQNAETVLAWLDPGSAASRPHNLELTLKKMETLSRTRKRDILPGSSWTIETDGKEFDALSSEVFWEVSELLHLPWFTRRWIVQEVVFNPDVRLIYGDVEFSWARFVATLSILFAFTQTYPYSKIWDVVTRTTQLWRYYSLFEQSSNDDRESHDTDIVKLLDAFDQIECTDPRDRIFALYNMASNLRPSTLPLRYHDDVIMDIDYSLDLRQTYEAFALACMRAGKLTTIIESVLSRQHSARPDGWASWAPDWRVNSLEKIVLPEPVRFYRPLKLEDWPLDVIRMRVNTRMYLPHAPYEAYPIIVEKAVGDTLLQQCSNLCTKVNKKDVAGDLKSLFDMLQCMVQQCSLGDYPEGKRAKQLRRMQGKVYVTIPQRDPDLHLMNLDALQLMLDMIIGPSKNMFFFEIPGAEKRSVGYGNTHLEAGDQLVPLFETDVARSDRASSMGAQNLNMVLIVRGAGTIDIKPSPETIYRLIGSGYIYDAAISADHLDRGFLLNNNFRELHLA
jgi:hypothetical protein